MCDLAQGCKHQVLTGTNCNDGIACTAEDLCANGTCVGMPNAATCSDGNQCTTDVCDLKLGCTSTFSANAACDDGNACSTGELCTQEGCGGGTYNKCDDGIDCTVDSCDSATGGCSHIATDSLCDDGIACTHDACTDGACANAIDSVLCDDGNQCTSETCVAAVGCKYNNLVDGSECTDGSNCTLGDACSGGNCVYEALMNCEDENVCTNDFCDPAAACVHMGNNLPCDDANGCTYNDGCYGPGFCGGVLAAFDMVYAATPTEMAYAITTTDEGGLAVVGSSDATPSNILEVLFMETDANGNTTKKLLYGYNYEERGNAITVAPGGYAVAGFLAAAPTPSDAYVVYIAEDPTQTWKKMYGGAGSDTANGILAVDDGFVVAGTRTSATNVQYCWVFRLDHAGNVMWEQILDQQGPSACNGLTTAANGDIVVVGTSQYGTLTGKPPTPSAGPPPITSYAFIAQLSPQTGEIAWEQVYSGMTFIGGAGKLVVQPQAQGVAIARAADGGFWVLGSLSQSNIAAKGGLLRVDAFGGVKWSQILNSETNNSFGRALAALPDGVAVLADWSENPYLAGTYFPAVYRFDETGSQTFVYARTSYTQATGRGIAISGKRLVVTGFQYDAGTGADPFIFAIDGYGHGTCEAVGVCIDQTLTSCADSSLCTIDGCDTNAGCTNTNKSCDDGNACTNDSCDAITGGCVHTANTDPCASQMACMVGQCSAGQCMQSPKVCTDDNNPCTNPGCDPMSGMCNAPSMTPMPCDDGDPCTSASSCMGASCMAMPGPSVCPVGHACASNNACLTGYCQNGLCANAPPTCMDGAKNGGESDVDCGGGTCPACPAGKQCFLNGDCQALPGMICIITDITMPGVCSIMN